MDTGFENSGPSADEALRVCLPGMSVFAVGRAGAGTIAKTLADLARGQRPYATILGCSDSRVPPEWVFDAGLGEALCRARRRQRFLAGNRRTPYQYAGGGT